ncbi:MAG: ABC transporter permease, partial [Gammaproteobacteria bacterium]
VEVAVAGGERAPNLLALFAERGITVKPVTLDEAGARRAIAAGDQRTVVVVPQDLPARLAAGQPADISLYFDRSSEMGSSASSRVRDAVDDYGRRIAQSRLLLRGVDPTLLRPVVVKGVDVSTPKARAVLALGTLTFFVILAMLTGGLYLAIDSTAGERERGSLEALLTTPLPRAHLLYGKILATTAYMLISLVVTLFALSLALQFTRLESWGMSIDLSPQAVLAMVLFTAPLGLAGAGLMTIVASFTRSFREAQTYLSFVLLVPTLPLALVNMLDLKPTVLTMATPSLSQHFLMTRVLRGEWPQAWEILLSVGATLALGLLLAWIAGRLYEREEILGERTGRTPARLQTARVPGSRARAAANSWPQRPTSRAAKARASTS